VVGCAGDESCTCCDTCCSTCCSILQRADDTTRHGSKLLQGSEGQTIGAHTAAASTPSSPFKIFRSSERRSDTDDSLEDSSNTLPHTPAYAGIDVEPVEKPLTEDDDDADFATPAVKLTHQIDTEFDVSMQKTHQKAGNDVIAGSHEEPLLLVPAASNTLDTLFGELSDSSSGEPVVNRSAVVNGSATSENNVVLAIDKERPSIPAKVSSSDIEEGEITDSDTEQSTTVLPLNVPAVANKENVKSRVQADTKQNQQNTNCAKQSIHSDREKAPKSTSRTPPQNRISRKQEQSPNSRQKSRSGSDTHHRDSRKSPQRNHAVNERRDRYESSGYYSERRNGSDACRTERRWLSPRKNANSAKFPFRGRGTPFRGRRNSAARFAWTPRRF